MDVVVAVHHRVFGVVGDRPEYVGEQQQPRHRRHIAELRGKRHRDAEAEGDAEIGLRDNEEALGERVAGGKKYGGKGQQPGQRVERQDQQKGGKRQPGGQPQRFALADLAAGERALPGAFDMLVDVAVGIVVDGASGGAHQRRAERKDQHDMPGRVPLARDPQSPQRRPQQQQNADGTMQTGELDIERKAFGKLHFYLNSKFIA